MDDKYRIRAQEITQQALEYDKLYNGRSWLAFFLTSIILIFILLQPTNATTYQEIFLLLFSFFFLFIFMFFIFYFLLVIIGWGVYKIFKNNLLYPETIDISFEEGLYKLVWRIILELDDYEHTLSSKNFSNSKKFLIMLHKKFDRICRRWDVNSVFLDDRKNSLESWSLLIKIKLIPNLKNAKNIKEIRNVLKKLLDALFKNEFPLNVPFGNKLKAHFYLFGFYPKIPQQLKDFIKNSQEIILLIVKIISLGVGAMILLLLTGYISSLIIGFFPDADKATISAIIIMLIFFIIGKIWPHIKIPKWNEIF